jgi:hypothetical protein
VSRGDGGAGGTRSRWRRRVDARGSRRASWIAAGCAAVLVAGVIVVVVANGGSKNTKVGSQRVPKGLLAALQDIGPEGLYSKNAALRLYGLLYGPLPGTTARRLDTGGFRIDGTIALLAIKRVEDQLTGAQRSVFEARLAAGGSAHTTSTVSWSGPVGLTPSGGVTVVRAVAHAAKASPDPAVQARIDEIIAKYRPQIAGHLGFDLSRRVRASVAPTQDPGADADAYEEGNACIIHVNPHTLKVPTAELELDLAHELFHCFQYRAYGDWVSAARAPGWVIEGGAEWAADTLVPDAPRASNWWPVYLKEPHTSLLKRAYDAIGFYSHLEETGHDPWATQPAMWALGPGASSSALFVASGATDEGFLGSWASSVVRYPSFGVEWDTKGPGITSDFATSTDMQISDGGTMNAKAGPYTLAPYYVESHTDVLEFDINGHGRVADGHVNTPQIAGSDFCTRSGGCECPGEPSQNQVPPAPLNSTSRLAVTGGPDGATGTVTGESLDKFCKKRGLQVSFPGIRPLALPAVNIVSCKGVTGPWTGTVTLLYANGRYPDLPIPVSFTVDPSGVGQITGSRDVSFPPYSSTYSLELTSTFVAQGTNRKPAAPNVMILDGIVHSVGHGGLEGVAVDSPRLSTDPTYAKGFRVTRAPAGAC